MDSQFFVLVKPFGCSQDFADMVKWHITVVDEGTGHDHIAFTIEASLADRYRASTDSLAIRGYLLQSDWSLSAQRHATALVGVQSD